MFYLSDIFCIPSGESRNFENRDIRTPVATRDVVVQRIYRSMENLRGFVGGRRFDPPRGLSRREELFSLEWLTEREPMLDSGRASRRIAPFESSVSTRGIREGRRLTSGLEVENWPSRFLRALMNREQKIIRGGVKRPLFTLISE